MHWQRPDSLSQDPVADPGYVLRLLRHLRQTWRIWLFGLLLVGGATSIFLELAGDVWEQERFLWDAPIMLAIHRQGAPWLDALMIGITRIGYPGAILATATAAAWLWWQRRPVAALSLLISVLGAFVLNVWLKQIFGRPRPTVFPPLTAETTFSFPSGHAMNAVALYGFLTYLLWQQKQRAWATLALLFALLIAFSRIYLGVHYPSDIVGALSIGLVWLVIVVMGYRYYRARYTRSAETEPEPLPAPSDLA